MTQLIHFGDYAGFRVLGTAKMPALSGDDKENHVKRAAWLTAQVESGGMYGCAISYDGTGVTACIHQAVALYPKEVWEADGKTEDDQGDLWKVTKRIIDAGVPGSERVQLMIDHADWILAADGKLRKRTGGFPSGKEMRVQLNGEVHGKTPAYGKDHDRSEAWVNCFAGMMSDPKSFPIQDAAGEEFIVKRAARAWVGTKGHPDCASIEDAIYDTKVGMDMASATVGDPGSISGMGYDLDLAMCVFWSHSVNAPGMALQCLNKAIRLYGVPTEQPSPEKSFPRILMKVFGTCGYGRWDDDIRGGRYQRTRDAAMESGLWPAELFEPKSLMPLDFPG